MNFNKVFILGNLTRDPELRTTRWSKCGFFWRGH
jgi:single-stranded DNA-binding protein